MTSQTLRERKDDAVPLTIVRQRIDDIGFHAYVARRCMYGRTSPRPGLCDFDAYGMDIVEGRA